MVRTGPALGSAGARNTPTREMRSRRRAFRRTDFVAGPALLREILSSASSGAEGAANRALDVTSALLRG